MMDFLGGVLGLCLLALLVSLPIALIAAVVTLAVRLVLSL